MITAAVPSAATRKLLRIPAGTAVMEVQRIGCLRDQPVEWRETLIRRDRFSVAALWSAQERHRMGRRRTPSAGVMEIDAADRSQ